MALTRITKGVIKPNEDFETRNVNSTGIVTATELDVNGNADISGSLSVGGVLTYEDVTSIDSVGIITARNDIHVGAGVSAVGVGTFGSLDISGDIDVDGHTNLDNVSVAGVVTATTFVGALTGNVTGNVSGNATGLTGNPTISVTDLDVDGHTNLDNVSIAGVVTATTFSGSGASLTGIRLDEPNKIVAPIHPKDVLARCSLGFGDSILILLKKVNINTKTNPYKNLDWLIWNGLNGSPK